MNILTTNQNETDGFFGSDTTSKSTGIDRLAQIAERLDAQTAETDFIQNLLSGMQMLTFYKITYLEDIAHYCFDVKDRKDLCFSLSGPFENKGGVKVICINNHHFNSEINEQGFIMKLNALTGLENKVSKETAYKIYREAFSVLQELRKQA